jgi:hypothetical protein
MEEQGWGHRLLQQELLRKGLPAHPVNHFVNNRVMAFHLGGAVIIKDVDVTFKVLVRYFGTYHTTTRISRQTYRILAHMAFFGRKDQFSAFLELDKLVATTLGSSEGAVDLASYIIIQPTISAIFISFR